ncbi:MAG TPA: DM9 repeat-containing protein [Coxiellaceae bacterium]|nr:DM9 repeat-containing protein [Coxiellaceae bacterium]
MSKFKKFLMGLCVAVILFVAGDFWLRHSTDVSLGLQLRRLWSGLVYGGARCRIPQYQNMPTNYLSMVVLNPSSSAQLPLLQLQMAKLRMQRYRYYLPADLNSLALAKKILGSSSIITLDYECASLRDLLEINQAQMQIRYLQKMIKAQAQRIKSPPVQQPLTPLNFPTSSANSNFNWIEFNSQNLPNNLFAAGKDLYVCQAQWQANNYPGQYVNGVCRLTYAGSVFDVKKFVLLSSNAKGQWIDSIKAKQLPAKPIYGGFENGAPMAICRINVEDVTHLGKVVNGSVCDVALSNQEMSFHKYEVLYPS